MTESQTDANKAVQAPSQGSEEPPYPSNFYAWYCVFVLLGIYLNSFLDRQILALLVGPIKASMGLSDTDIGFLQGMAFALFYTIAGLPLGWLADRMSRRVLITIGQIFWSIASVSFGLGRSFTQLIAARVGVGVGEASLSPSAYSLIADLFPTQRLGRALSLYSAGIYLGGGLANVIGGQLTTFYEPGKLYDFPVVGERFGWQVVFFFIALPTIPLTLMLLTLKEPARRGMARAGGGAATQVPVGEFFRYWWANRGATATHAFGFAALSFSGYGVGAWLPEFFIRMHGWTPRQAGPYLGLTAMILGPIGLFSAGSIADYLTARGRSDAKMRVGLWSAVAWFPFGIAVPLMPTGELAFLAYIPAFFLSAWSWGVAPASLQEIMPNQIRGQASALYLFILNFIGLGLGPWMLGVVTDSVFKDENQIHLSLLSVTVVAHLVAAFLLWRGLPHYRTARKRLEEWVG